MMQRRMMACLLAGLALTSVPALAQNDAISTFAGGGPNNLAATSSNLNQPTSVAVDAAGNFYVASPTQNRVFRINAATGKLTVFAGNGSPGFSGSGGPAAQAALHSPEAVALDSAGNLYIADTQNNVIRKVNLAGNILTVAGTGSSGFSGDGGPALSATMARPFGLAVDAAGDIFFCDIDNNRVRKVNAAGIVSTVAGNGQAGFGGDGGPAVVASLDAPMSVAVNSSGNVFISDSGNHRIRKVAPGGVITTVAGNGGASSPCTVASVAVAGLATALSLSDRTGVGVGPGGTLYIADTGAGCVRSVDSTGTMTTVAGDGNFAFAGDGGSAIMASMNSPVSVSSDAAGSLYISDTGNLRIRKVVNPGLGTSEIGTVAGNGVMYSGNSVPATNSSLDTPQGVSVAADAFGNIYVADSVDNLVRKISSSGTITTVAGNGCFGYRVGSPPACDLQGDAAAGDAVLAVNASLAGPTSVAVDGAGNVYIADSSNQRIRKVNTAGVISTVAGDGTQGNSGDGGPAINAELSFPGGIAVDGVGGLYIADTENHRIRKVDGSGNISTFAGTGAAGFGGDGGLATIAMLNFPTGVAFDLAGTNLYIADQSNHRVRRVTLATQDITTVAGNGTGGFSGDSGPATSANLDFPTAVTLDSAGNLFVADFANQRIRRVDAVTQNITTVAGNGSFGFSGDGGPANLSMLANPGGVGVDPAGNLLIADTFNNRIRRVTAPIVPFITLSPSTLDFPSQVLGTTSAGLAVTVNNTGDAPLTFDAISIQSSSGAPSADFSETDTCTSPLAIGAGCAITVTFSPSVAGDRVGTLVLTDNGAGSPQTIPLAGTGTTSSIAISQTSLTFGNQGVGSTSAYLTLAITSTGNGPLSLTSVVATGDFGQTNNCGTTVPPLTTCTVSVSFTPTATGARTGTLTLTDNDLTSPQTVALSGTGVQAYALLADRTSATVLRGVDTATFNFSASSIYNFTSNIDLACNGNGTAVCSFSPTSIAVGQNSVLTVSNLSAITGSSVSFAVEGTSGSQTSSQDISISIADFSISASPNSATVTAGGTASYTLSIQPSGGFNQPVALNCTGAPLAATCSVSPITATPDGTHAANVTVNVTTAAIATARMIPEIFFPGGDGARIKMAFFCLVFLSGVVIYLLKIRRRAGYLLAILTILVLSWVGCGGGNTLPLLRGTPAGTYTLSVAAASGNLSHTTNLTLTVK